MSKRLLIAIALTTIGIGAVAAAFMRTPERGLPFASVSQTSHRANWSFGADGTARLPDGLTLEIRQGIVTGVIRQGDVPNEDAWSDLLGTRYVIDDVDATDVTRQLWRHIKLEMRKDDNSKVNVELARPLWWIDQNEAKVGGTVELDLSELGVAGPATVLAISACTEDSRENPDGSQLVTGKFEHENAIVLDLEFNNDSDNPLGVTANHLLFSEDRDDWVPAGEVQIRETLRTADGIATLTGRKERPGRHKVYNLEVHRAHCFYVGEHAILAHNSKAAPIRVASGAGADAAEMAMVRTINRGEKIADLVDEAKRLTFTTGNEHAIVKLTNGQRAIVSGGPTGIIFQEGQITRLFGHTHPYHLPPTGPSAGDIDALRQLGQRSSYILEHGELFKFFVD